MLCIIKLQSECREGKMAWVRNVNWGEALLWAGFVASIAFIEDEGLDALTAMGVFAIAAIGVRATRPIRAADATRSE